MLSVRQSVTLSVSENNYGCECVEMQEVIVGRRLGKQVILPVHVLNGFEMNLFSHFIFHKINTGGTDTVSIVVATYLPFSYVLI